MDNNTEKRTCYTCIHCKSDNLRGSIYCSTDQDNGKCLHYDAWESYVNVLDRVRADIVSYCHNQSEMGEHPTEYGILQIVDKYRNEYPSI